MQIEVRRHRKTIGIDGHGPADPHRQGFADERSCIRVVERVPRLRPRMGRFPNLTCLYRRRRFRRAIRKIAGLPVGNTRRVIDEILDLMLRL